MNLQEEESEDSPGQQVNGKGALELIWLLGVSSEDTSAGDQDSGVGHPETTV